MRNLKKLGGTAVFSFQFLFFISFFSMHHILQEKTFHVSCWWGHLGDLAASTKNTAVHFPHLGRSHRCRPLTKPRSCEFEWGKIVTYCIILLHIEESIHRRNAQKIPPGTYILLVWKIRMPKDFPCWHMWTCGVWNRGLEMTETIPFFSSAIGQGSLHFQHDNLSETCTFIRILLRHGYGPKAFAEELWEALKYVLPASCLDEFAPEKQQTQVGKAQGWCFFLQYLPNYLRILVGLPFFCMHDHCQRKSLRNSSQLQDDICIHLQCI